MAEFRKKIEKKKPEELETDEIRTHIAQIKPLKFKPFESLKYMKFKKQQEAGPNIREEDLTE